MLQKEPQNARQKKKKIKEQAHFERWSEGSGGTE